MRAHVSRSMTIATSASRVAPRRSATAPGDVTLQRAHVCARRAAHTLLLTSRHRLRHRDAM
ncbi:hypothetical protein XMIN_1670 [Xanthomonas citri pv. mangiferaeindicae LMG 941]|nr:hypothetical protein XMIN_1670 [Xanthomonas citri pv. mangiferaeindicae LMG 941]